MHCPVLPEVEKEGALGHGAMPGTKKMPDLELILKVVMPSMIRPYLPFQKLCLYHLRLPRHVSK